MSRSRSSSIEVLESRIAPALLINGANLLGGSSPATGESSAGGNSATVVKVLSGQAIVWYQDGDILGISVGPNSSLEIQGDVIGDIVANLLPNGRLSDSDNNPVNGEDGAVLLPNNIVSLKTFPLSGQKGSVHNIITAGSVTNVNVQGELNGIFAGDGAFDPLSHVFSNGQVTSSLGSLDFNPVESGKQSNFVFTKAVAETIDPVAKLKGMLPGAAVANVTVGKAMELQIFAGSGDPNELHTKTVAGGNITNITISSAFSSTGGLASQSAASYELHAGAGSSGAIGGAGGFINNIKEATATGKVIATAGAGGTGATGPGGAGGSITNYNAGSDSSQYLVTAGAGGSGIPGGAGGSVVGNNFSNRSVLGGILVAGKFFDPAADYQDLLVIDQGTGQMVVEHNANQDGSNFTPVVQHVVSNADVTTIASKGSTPTGAFADDVDGNGTIDIVVAYSNSNSLGIYLNQGNGVFWDSSLNNGAGDYAGTTVPLQFSPSKITESGSRIVAAENGVDGKSALHLLARTITNDGVLTYTGANGANSLPKPVADLVTLGDGTVLVGTVDGALRRAVVSGVADGLPFVVSDLAVLSGGLSDLDVDSTGNRILAIGPTARAFSIYDFDGTTASGSLTLFTTVTGLVGKPLAGHFISDGVDTTPDQVAILEGLSVGARVDVYTLGGVAGAATSTLSKTVNETNTLKNFIPVYSQNSDAGFAALSSSLSQFTFSDGFVGGVDYSLPFGSKIVEIHGGKGGDGIDFQPMIGKLKSGRGGLGGSITNLNAEATTITLSAGKGGDSVTNGGGAGGSISNPVLFDATGAPLVNTLFLRADKDLTLNAGNGGAPTTAGTKAAGGGAGGSISNLDLELAAGDLLLTAGIGGDSRGGAAGAGGSINGMTTLLHDGSLTLQAGDGGDAFAGAVLTLSGVGGAAGSINSLRHELRLEADVENAESAYFVKLIAGIGGDSPSAAGGSGGSVTGVSLKLDEANITYDDAAHNLIDSHKDSTVATSIMAGDAGNGTIGGNGGLISGLKYGVVLDQVDVNGNVRLGAATLLLKGGKGGIGSVGAGGNGGSITLTTPISGVSFLDLDSDTDNDPTGIDPIFGIAHPLDVHAGDGNNGATKGGAGGDISGLTAQNQLFVSGAVITNTMLNGALIQAGKGGDGGLGDGGRGGNVLNTLIGVQNSVFFFTTLPSTGQHVTLPFPLNELLVFAGKGGDGGTTGDTTTAAKAKGGLGGSISGGEFGLVSTNELVGMDLEAGPGGKGFALGGAGGALSGLKLNSSQSTDAISSILIAGKGGDSQLATGIGGKGGDVTGVSQNKDVNSSINLIRAGNGGDNLLGKAGAGGNVTAIKTVGFIGRPSNSTDPLGVIDTVTHPLIPQYTVTIPQGLFTGRGGVGSSTANNGVNGFVNGVTARQIAAIAAAMNQDGTFAAASKVSNVTADLIGFDKDRGTGTAADGIFNDSQGGTAAPDMVAPQDGFIFSLTPLVNVKVATQRPSFVFAPPA